MLKINLENTDWGKIKKGVQSYVRIMHLVKNSNVQTNKEFQKKFNGFYVIRQRSKEFYKAFYEYLEHNKYKNISFEQTLNFFQHKFQRFEPSFSSKIVATINPNFPIWDSEVLKRLNIKRPFNLAKEVKFKRMVKIYDDIMSWYSEFLKTEQAKNMIKTFDEKIGKTNITDTKKIDLILWQTREIKQI